MLNASQKRSESEPIVATFVVAINWIASKPSVNGDFSVLLNPIGATPAYNRRPGCSVTWQLWLSEAKAAEYRALKTQADAMSAPHKVFVTAEFEVRDGKALKENTQVNVLKFLTKAHKEIRPVLAAVARRLGLTSSPMYHAFERGTLWG